MGHCSIPPYSEAVLHCTTRTVGGRSLPPSGLLEGLTVFSENTGLVVGQTLVDPSGWKVPVLVSNFGPLIFQASSLLHTYIVRLNRPSQCTSKRIPIQKRSRITRTSSLWATVLHGTKDLRIHPCLPASKRCSHWRVAWDMKCVRLPDNRMLSVDPREIGSPLTRIADFVLLHGPAEITHELSASAAASLAICKVVVRDRTLPCRLNQRDGICSRTTGLLVMATTVRETLSRSGHHPHRSIRTSSGPFVIFIHHIDLVNSATGNRYHN